MRGAERFARCAHEIAFQSFLRRKRDRMQEKIDSIRFPAHFFEEILYFGVVRHVAWKERNLFTESRGQFLHVFFQPLALIVENQPCAGIRPCLRDCPCNRALVRDTEDKTDFSFQNGLGHTRSTITAFVAKQKYPCACSTTANRVMNDIFL